MEIEDHIYKQIKILDDLLTRYDNEKLASELDNRQREFNTALPYTVGAGTICIYELYMKVCLRDIINRISIAIKSESLTENDKKLIGCVEALQEQIDAHTPNETSAYDICKKCHIRTEVNIETSEMECPGCGQVTILRGIIFKDDQLFPSEGQKVKTSSYKTSKHFNTWMNRILAVEQPKIGKDFIKDIKEDFRNRGIARDIIDYKMVRLYLKRVKLTEFNDYISWILKEVSGRAPPDISFDDRVDIEYRFNAVIDAFDRIRERTLDKPVGRKYYPFFIYKIVKYKFAKYPRKLRLLDYIHEQQDKTLKNNEDLFEEILVEAANPRISSMDK